MATALQLHNLRVKLNDFTDKDGNILEPNQQAFRDTELDTIYDDAANEVNDHTTPLTLQGEAWAMLVARADGILLLAHDESRRLQWTINNKTVNETGVSKGLTDIARELRLRYENAKNRQQALAISMTAPRPASARMDFNNTVKPHSARNFDNMDVKRNSPNTHKIQRNF